MTLLRHTTLWRVGAALTALSILPATQAQSVFDSDFESPDFTPGLLISDPDWFFDASLLEVEITDQDFANGLQSVNLFGDETFQYFMDPLVPLPQVLWVDFSLKPVFADEQELPLDFSLERTAVTGFVKVNSLGEIYAVDGDGAGSGQWLGLGHTTALNGDQSLDWMRLTYRLDYSTLTWDLFVDGSMVAIDLGFLNTDALRFKDFTLRGDGFESSGFDSFQLQQDNPLFTDADNDAIDDAYEVSQGLNTSVNDRYSDADSDSLNNLEEYMAGLAAGNADSDGDGLLDPYDAQWIADPAADASVLELQADGSLATRFSFDGTDGYRSGWLGAQNGWEAGPIFRVSAEDAAAGDQSLATVQVPYDSETESAINDYSVARHYLDANGADIVWVSFQAKLQYANLYEIDLSSNPAVAFALSGENALAIYDSSYGHWREAYGVVTSGGWVQYDLELDYTGKVWRICVDGKSIFDGIPFVDPTRSSLQQFTLLQQNGDAPGSWIDEIVISDTEPAGLDFDGDGLDNATERNLGSNLESEDSDGDGMSDLYEQTHGLNLLANDANGDADGDGLKNIQEFNFGSDPFDPENYGAYGFVRRDAWTSLGGDYSIEELTNKTSYPLSPNLTRWATDLDFPKNENFGTTYGQRVYGMIVAPETGEYTFRLSGDKFYEFWLSDSELPSRRKLLAKLTGISRQEKFTVTSPVSLVAGQSYYFELLHTEDVGAGNNVGADNHIEVKWRYNDVALSSITSDHLRVSIPEAGDADKDGLPDAWEIANGLDAAAGFGVNGYAGDFDGDGLANYEEYHLGTDPTLADSDGDGHSDYAEVTHLFSDPMVDDLDATPVVVGQVDGSGHTGSTGMWLTEGTDLYSVDATGSVSYDLNFAQPGAYRLIVEVSEHNSFKQGDSLFELRASLNGISYGVDTATVSQGSSDDLVYYLPYLSAGSYALDLDWLNGFSDSQLRIGSIRVEQIDGADADASGIADWIENRAEQFGSEEIPVTVYTSPFCIEGQSYAPASVSVTSYPQADATDLRVEESKQALAYSYYADIALNPDEPRVIEIDDQLGLRTAQLNLNWEAFNAFVHDYIHVRLDDSLLLAAFDPALAEIRPVEFVMTSPSGVSETHALAAGARLQALFDQAGLWTLSATILPIADEAPILLDSEIRVSSASLAPAPIVMSNTAREWAPTISDTLVELEADSFVALSERVPDVMPRVYDLYSNADRGRVIARLPEGGSIVDVTELQVIRDYSRTQTHNQVVETFADGTVMVSAYIYLNEVPEGLSMQFNIVKSGMTFDDGTNQRTITAEDFDEQGRYRFYMLRAPGVNGGNCYQYWFEQDGITIGSW